VRSLRKQADEQINEQADAEEAFETEIEDLKKKVEELETEVADLEAVIEESGA
jgi:peptidoglycan hydrolase CwlO-like protein